MDFNDPSNHILVNSMELWDPYYLNKLFKEDFDNVDTDVFNCSMSDSDLLKSVECRPIEKMPYQPIVEDITMDDNDQLTAVNEIESG